MSTTVTAAGSGPYLRWIVASEYYDGEMAGVGVRTDDEAPVWFRVLAWDSEQWQRVFAVARIDGALLDKLVKEHEKLEPRRSPFWLPGPASGTAEVHAIWNEIVSVVLESGEWWIAEGHDLLEPAIERPVGSSDIVHVVRAARSGALITESGPGLTEGVLRRIRTQAG